MLHFYASDSLERKSHLRSQPDTLQTLLHAPETVLTVVWGQKILFTPHEHPCPQFFPVADAARLLTRAEEILFLGQRGETPVLALFFPDSAAPPYPLEGVFLDIREHWSLLEREDAALLAFAKGLSYWHMTHRFCGVCGNPTRAEQCGHVRKCSAVDCGRINFPRTDPAVIMRVTDGDWCLLGRHPNWPAGMHSVLAGFLEIGESLEQAVVREVWEEVGLKVRNVRYHSSQPWPFPASLMVGFTAEASRHAPLTLDPEEIQSARWYHRDELRTSPEDETFKLPRKISIARALIEDWLDQG